MIVIRLAESLVRNLSEMTVVSYVSNLMINGRFICFGDNFMLRVSSHGKWRAIIEWSLMFIFLSLLLTPVTYAATAMKKHVTVYLLIDSPQQLKQYTDDLHNIGKANFNRVVFSFVRPTLLHYEKGNLANTGIMGYFDQGDGQGRQSFQQLKAAIELSKSKSIETFLSVGGWNYSCNYALYASNCGAPGLNYDYFPDPNDPDEATIAEPSYKNLVKLSNDLGVDGIDFDYEEFWHADVYATPWAGQPWATEIAKMINKNGGPTYDNLMHYATGSGASFAMPKTVDKVAAILHALIDNPAAQSLRFATAAPPVGARPITGFVYGDNKNDVYTKGGLWWKGNLKGLWYNLADKDLALVNRFDSIGLMTYDLCGDNPTLCAPYGAGPLDLAGQVDAYMMDHQVWLKSDHPAPASLSISDMGKVDFLPAKFNVTSSIQFGFEVNQPAYPKNPSGQLQLTNALVDIILQQQKNSGGVIIWQMYSNPNTQVADATTSRYAIGKSCQTFLAKDTHFDCNAKFPSISH